jgi:hypothetical protein
MADPISLTGAITVSIKLLSLAGQTILSFKRHIDDYQILGKKLQDHQEDAEFCKMRLECWSRFWGISSSDEASTGIKQWGVEGWKIVEKMLARVDDRCEDLVISLAPFNSDEEVGKHLDALAERRERKANQPPTKKLQKDPPSTVELQSAFFASLSSDSRREALQKRQGQAKALGAVVGVKAKLDLVHGTSNKITKQIGDLKDSIAALEDLSHQIFLDRYPDLPSSASVTERRNAVEKNHHEEMLGHAERLRTAAKELYQTCCNRHAEDVRLTMEMLAMEDLERHVSTYRVIYEPTTDQSQVLTMQALKCAPSGEVYETFEDAFKVALQNAGHVAFHLGAKDVQYYAVQIFPNKSRLERQSLADVLEEIAKMAKKVDRWELLPVPERDRLAYLLAESALFLLGTSWLSALSSKNLSRPQDQQNAPYLLRILESDQRRCRLLRILKQAAAQNLLDLQCWSLGILLIEVKLGVKVIDVIGRDNRVLLVLADESEIDIDGTQLTGMCGSAFSAAVRHCFKPTTELSSRNFDDKKYRRMLERFYKRVFLP